MTSWPLLLVIPPLTRSPCCRQGSADFYPDFCQVELRWFGMYPRFSPNVHSSSCLRQISPLKLVTLTDVDVGQSPGSGDFLVVMIL